MTRTLPAHPINAATLDHRLKLYSLAAAVAGVSALALSQPAEAEVVITNKNIPVPLCGDEVPCSISIDLNGDGINDFKFSLISSYDYGFLSRRLHVKADQNGGGVMGTAGGKHGPYASCLLRGAKIGASDHFLARGNDTVEDSYIYYRSLASHGPKELYGKWGGNHPNRFLGLKFKIDGETHYGWIRMTVDTVTSATQQPVMSATITEYGYETVANKTLDAGLSGADSADDQAQETGQRPRQVSLGMLAFGADGLALWRREEVLAH
jgi:hypothetical protein